MPIVLPDKTCPMHQDGNAWDRVEELLRFQGRSWGWLAARARMSTAKMRALKAGRPHYVLHDWQKRLIAEALGVPVKYLWDEVCHD